MNAARQNRSDLFLAFARLESRAPWLRVLILAGLSAVLGLAWYLVLYGRFGLYVTHVNWIYNAGGDMLQHQLGWEFFRNDPWQFPLGQIRSLGYPAGTSVTYMDAIPLLAIPFKLLSPWLETSFQYFGLWELLCVVLQMLWGMLIMREFTRSLPLAVVGASLLVLSPAMIFRAFYHSSLAAHWIVLASIWLAIRAYRGRLWRPAWPLLFGTAMLVHIYYIPMLAPLWLIALYFCYRDRRPRWGLALDAAGAVGAIVLTGYVSGVFSLGFQNLMISGYGLYSWNLNGLVNPLDFSSAFLKGFPITGGQYEGFSYLGLGGLLLGLVAAYLFPQAADLRKHRAFFAAFGAAALVFTLFALTNKAAIGLQPVWDWSLPDGLYRFFCLFRSSGRFIWPVVYFALILGLATVIRRVRYPGLVLGFVLLLQFADLRPLYAAKKQVEFSVYASPLQADFWQPAADTNRHVVVLPAKKVREFASDPLAIWAAHQRLTLNYGYIARSNQAAIRDYADLQWAELAAGRPDAQTLYFFADAEWTAKAKETLAQGMYLCAVDGYTLAFSRDNRLAQAEIDLAQTCSIPVP